MSKPLPYSHEVVPFSKAMPVGRVATRWKQLPKPVRAGVWIGAPTATGIYGYGSYRGTNLRQQARTEYQGSMTAYERMLEERSHDPRYKNRGNNVYVRDRRWFGGPSKVTVDQLVRENKGRGPIYAHIGYDTPWNKVAATTYPHDKQRATAMNLRPGLANSGKNRLKGRYFATHEHQHVKDYAGKGKQKKMVEDALTVAYRKHPRQGAAKDFFTGRGWKRLGAFSDRMMLDVGYGEGRADAAAARRHRVPAHAVSGYPYMAAMNGSFGTGYTRGGGKPLNSDWAVAMQQQMAADRQFQRISRQHRPKKKG